jgi:NDP-sugar pyrophosphorylase family protein
MNDKFKKQLNLDATIAKDLFEHFENPWEVLPYLSDTIKGLIQDLDRSEYDEIADDVFVHNTAIVDTNARIIGPAIIGKHSVIRFNAYIRGDVIIGDNCVVGNSSELKNAILFNHAQCPHFNYIGDAIMGEYSHTGAGVIMSNLKSDGSNINVYIDGEKTLTDLRKFGGLLCDNVEVGCNSVILPGTIVEKNSTIYPLTRVRGIIYEDKIVKDEKTIVKKK